MSDANTVEVRSNLASSLYPLTDLSRPYSGLKVQSAQRESRVPRMLEGVNVCPSSLVVAPVAAW